MVRSGYMIWVKDFGGLSLRLWAWGYHGFGLWLNFGSVSVPTVFLGS